ADFRAYFSGGASIRCWFARRVAFGQNIAGPVGALPVRYRRTARLLGHELRALDQLVAVDVAGAVGEDLPNRHPDDELRVRVGRHQLVVLVDGGDSVDPH